MTDNGSSARRLAHPVPGRDPNVALPQFRRPFLAFLAIALGLSAAPWSKAQGLQAQGAKPTEYEVEAAYLSNFGRFVVWPARAGGGPPGQGNNEPFYVCVLGQDPFGALLDAALKGEAIRGAPMSAKRISGPEDATGCRILFMGSLKDSQLSATLASLGTSSVLTVSDMPEFTRRGGMIQFVLEGNRVRFEINLAAAQRARLTLSSELLKVAITIRRAP